MMKETKTIELKHTHPHKIDVNKIKTLDDVIQILDVWNFMLMIKD